MRAKDYRSVFTEAGEMLIVYEQLNEEDKFINSGQQEKRDNKVNCHIFERTAKELKKQNILLPLDLIQTLKEHNITRLQISLDKIKK